MADINFPSAPSTNDTHTDASGVVWIYDGKRWLRVPYDTTSNDETITGDWTFSGDPHFTGTPYVKLGTGVTDNGLIFHPLNAHKVDFGLSTTGAFEITLPTLDSSDGISMDVTVWTHGDNKSFTVKIQGLTGSTGWVSTSVQVLSSLQGKYVPTVRFGDDGSKQVIWIGELADVWAWPDISVTNVMLRDGATVTEYLSGWSIAIEPTSFGTVDKTHVGNAPIPRTNLAMEWTATQNFDRTTLTDGATISWDASLNQVCVVTLGGNRTMAAPTNQKAGGYYSLTIAQDGTGSRTLTWNTVFKFTGGNAPVLSTGASAVDVIVFTSNGGNMYEVGRSLNVS